MNDSIAIVGMACRYPDAASPAELWENVLAQRRSFRRIPAERLRLADYYSPDRSEPDKTYSVEAALIENYEFDRVAFRVVGSTHRSADLAHWLALDIASQALADAGFGDGDGLPRDTTGVLVGNTLTGEFSRANTIRLRWPYVRRVVEAKLRERAWSIDKRRTFLNELEDLYKQPFPTVGEETLSGSLSNTIAGRLCNHFDLKGGGYTVDGACAASLLSVITACTSLMNGDLDVAIAGGVDLSLDPFELVGFAKTGALAPDEMRVYDERSAGFWPGEGCGFMVLMRHADAEAQDRRIYATIPGWGVSSDGSGGITRPTVDGQLLALQRAYRRAEFGIDTIHYFEGHGTGTRVGDATELQVLAQARHAARAAPPAVIGSIKANIGHTKAAAGIAGLLKATMAVHSRILPPTTGCDRPHPLLLDAASPLKVLAKGAPWPNDRPRRAGVSAMGFGGINTHIVLQGTAGARRPSLNRRERALLGSAQDAELLLFGASDRAAMIRQVDRVLTYADRLSRSEISDLAAELSRTLNDRQVRAALVVSSPSQLAERLTLLRAWLDEGVRSRLDMSTGLFLAAGGGEPRIGFVFPGQGSPVCRDAGALGRRFESAAARYDGLRLPEAEDDRSTAIAQPAIVNSSMAALRVLRELGVEASVAVGHSLGELTALHWAGAFGEAALLRIAMSRGAAMARLGAPSGAMASLVATPSEVEAMIGEEPVVIAGLNTPRQTVISGDARAVSRIVDRASAAGGRAVVLPVSHAFHSPAVEAIAPVLAEQLAGEAFEPLNRPVISTVTGGVLETETDLRQLLCDQVTSPVRFSDAASILMDQTDLLIEVGPGQVLTGMLEDMDATTIVAVDVGGQSLKGLLRAIGAAYALGTPLDCGALVDSRFTRPFSLDWNPKFFINPCELAPVCENGQVTDSHETTTPADDVSEPAAEMETSESPLDLFRRLVADRAELPPTSVQNDDRLLSDLHLNSLTVGQVVVEAARRLGLSPPVAPTDYADATIGEVGDALGRLSPDRGGQSTDDDHRLPAGVDEWVRAFTFELIERPLSRRPSGGTAGECVVMAPPGGHPLAEPLLNALRQSPLGDVVAVCLPPCPSESHVDLLLQGAHRALANRGEIRFVVVQHDGGGAAFAKTLHMESPKITVCVVDLPLDHSRSVEWIIAETTAAAGYHEVHYDALGRRFEPSLQLLPLDEEAGDPPLDQTDVVLVTGGGKGIAAECALAVARTTSARLALMGRSDPDIDRDLAANLAWMSKQGVSSHYVAADVTDRRAVEHAVGEIQSELGPITALLHGAGANSPQVIGLLDREHFIRTQAPKVRGVANVLAAIDPDRLRVLVTFGSIIARIGLPGEADYATANEWLTMQTQRWSEQHPQCRCLAVEWSIWSDVGMGQRLNRVEALRQRGVTPITAQQGTQFLLRLLSQPLPHTSVVVTGRFGDPPTLKIDGPELPLFRFLERPLINYPKVELVVEAELSTSTDPYLNDHVFRGQRLLPAVIGLEAMAQTAMALSDRQTPPTFEAVHFNRPVIVPDDGQVTIRLAALRHPSGSVDVAVRSSETAFQTDHFNATCRFEDQSSLRESGEPIPSERLELDPQRDLYGGLLFHEGRFRRLAGYRQLRAKACVAELSAPGATSWFGQFLSEELVLGDPSIRDATIHAIQACIPHRMLLPIGADRIEIGRTPSSGPLFVHAQERSRDGTTFVYDAVVRDAHGIAWERWTGLQLRAIDDAVLPEVWAPSLLGAYLERRIHELLPSATVTVVLHRAAGVERRTASVRAIHDANGHRGRVHHRPDGKPETSDACEVSASHAGDLILAVSALTATGCDLEPVVNRTKPVWEDLLGSERFALAKLIAQQADECSQTAATRVWAAIECLKKAGAALDAPLLVDSTSGDGWVVLGAGRSLIATLAATVRDVPSPLVIAVLVTPGDGQVRGGMQSQNRTKTVPDALAT